MPVVLQWLWLIGGMSLVKGYIHKCVTCRRLRSRLLVQKMSDLPSDRLQEAAPFTYTGVGMFGPFIVRKGRSDVKSMVPYSHVSHVALYTLRSQMT